LRGVPLRQLLLLEQQLVQLSTEERKQMDEKKSRRRKKDLKDSARRHLTLRRDFGNMNDEEKEEI